MRPWQGSQAGQTTAQDARGNATSHSYVRSPSYVTERRDSAGGASSTAQHSRKSTKPSLVLNQDAFRHANKQVQNGIDMGIHTGRRPTGVRLPTPPLSTVTQGSPFDVPPPKSGSRLNLLNPMSLLARRRTSQAVPQLRPESLVTKQGSDTYDFQIKGKYVHDFSAPRVKRNVSYESRLHSHGGQYANQQRNDSLPLPHIHDILDSPASPWSGGNHTPVFTENFDEEQYPAAGPHVRKTNDFSDLSVPKPPYAKDSARKINDSLDQTTEDLHSRRISYSNLPVSGTESQISGSQHDHSAQGTTSVSGDGGGNAMETSSTSAKSRKGRSRNVSSASMRENMPRHMKSTSSRFSFDMIGAAEQERVMEERHRQKALGKKTELAADFEEYDEEFDYDAMMEDDGLEERIPGVNADLEDDDFDENVYEEDIPGVNIDEIEAHNDRMYEEEIPEFEADEDDEPIEAKKDTPGFSGFVFQQSLASPLSPHDQDTVSTPRDLNGEVIGFAISQGAAKSVHSNGAPMISPLPFDSHATGSLGIEQSLQGLGLQGIELSSDAEAKEGVSSTKERGFPRPHSLDDDDLYFDDGIIGEQDADDAGDFDESVFDNVDTDRYGRPIRSLSSLPTLYSPPQLTADPSPSFAKGMGAGQKSGEDLRDVAASREALAPKPSVLMATNPLETMHTLTTDSLAAYQSALAEAANRAAAEGKFRRESTSSFGPPLVATDAKSPLNMENNAVAQNPLEEPFDAAYDLEDDFDYDDDMEDDAIIAAANAEALANDTDGFYGQEFNFYSAPAAKEAEFVNGGYFGGRGMDGLGRSKSGRIVVQEPNLTPITERSETSNRNSVMGFSMNRADIVSPGLAQLASMLREDYSEGDLSLDALMKLRRGAWGGSQASLHSSNAGSPRSPATFDGPNAHQNVWSPSTETQQPLHQRRNSGFKGVNIVSDSVGENKIRSGMEIGPPSEPNSQPPSPTYVRSNSALAIDRGPRSPRSPRSPGQISPTFGSSLSRRGSVDGHGREDRRGSFRKHRHTSSADSISYVKEEDPVNGERWILERRRTADSGEVEIGREVVSGGRI